LAVEQVLAGEHFLNPPLVLGNLPKDPVADNRLALFATWMAYHFAAIGRFHPNVATVASDNQAFM
jgi:hypothetical protein